MLFRLLPNTGDHVVRKDDMDFTYKSGDVVESETDLVAKFVNKFVRLDAELPSPSVPQPSIPVPHRFVKSETLVEPEVTEPEVTEPEVTEPEVTE